MLTHRSNEQFMNILEMNLDKLFSLFFNKKFNQVYSTDRGLLDEISIKNEVSQAIRAKPQVYSMFRVFLQALMCNDALNLSQAMLGMNMDGDQDSDVQFYDYHLNHFAIAFEE